jgi:RNA polymerase sigma-70 factor (ECF subfamily)
VAEDDPRLVLLEGAEAERLVVRHQAGVWRYLRAMGCDVNEADDLTQDTFVSVLRRPFTDYGEVATSAYLRRVAFSRLVSIRRKSGREKLVGELHELDIVWGRLAGGDQWEVMLEALQLCLKSLSDRARLALQLRYRDRVPRAGIADALEITEHGVKNLMQRAKKQLRTCIERRIS